MPPGSTRSATVSGPLASGSRESRNSRRERAPVAQRRPVGGHHLDLVVVGEDLGGGAGQVRVDLGADDAGAVTDAAAQPRRADAAPGAELGHRPAARRRQRREQPPGLVAAERDVAAAAGHVEGLARRRQGPRVVRSSDESRTRRRGDHAPGRRLT